MSNTNNGTPYSDQTLYDLSVTKAYEISDHAKGDILTVGSKSVTIIDIQHDSNSGFDAMAVRDEGGNIAIVYGGTNNAEGNQDAETDAGIAETYVGGSTPEQFRQAQEFRDRVKNSNPTSEITLTGHSLGGGLSNSVALNSNDHAVNFNPAPLPYDLGTVLGNGASRTDIVNYQTSGDPLGNATATFGGYTPGQIKIFGMSGLNPLEQHNMENVHFDKNGVMVDDSGKPISSYPNSNLSTGNPLLDELARSSKLAFMGAAVATVGLVMCLNPVTFIPGAVLVVGGGLMIVAAVARDVQAIAYEVTKNVIPYIAKKINEAASFVVNGAIDIAKNVVKNVQNAIKFANDVAKNVASAVVNGGAALIKAGYEALDNLHNAITKTTQFIENSVTLAFTAMEKMKTELFNLTYEFIRGATRNLFEVWEIIELLGSMAAQLMVDIIALNWDKIDDHIIAKIDEFQSEAHNDFMNSSRGFNQDDLAEISNDLHKIKSDLERFSNKVTQIKQTFRSMENSISQQVSGIGGEICLSF